MNTHKEWFTDKPLDFFEGKTLVLTSSDGINDGNGPETTIAPATVHDGSVYVEMIDYPIQVLYSNDGQLELMPGIESIAVVSSIERIDLISRQFKEWEVLTA